MTVKELLQTMVKSRASDLFCRVGGVARFSVDGEIQPVNVGILTDKDLDRITYRTKGDANNDVDAGLTLHSQVIGKVVYKLPILGYLVSFVKTQLGFTLLIVIPATVIIYSEPVVEMDTSLEFE